MDRTTIIIINSIRPYGYELNNILALPIGFSYRCRFRREWVDLPTPQGVVGTDGILVLRVFQTAQFIPVRRVKIKSASVVGDIYHIKYQLGDWISLPADEEERRKKIKGFNQLLSAALGDAENPANANLRRLVFSAADLAYDFSQSPESNNDWGILVNELQTLDLFSDVDFVKIVSLRDENGAEASVSPGVGFELANGATYSMEVIQRTKTGSTGNSGVGANRTLRLIFDQTDFYGLQAAQSITGRYDLLTFIFRVDATRLPKVATQILRVDPDGSGGNSDRARPWIPDILIPMSLKAPKLQVLGLGIRVVLAAVALAIYIAPQVFVPRDALSLLLGLQGRQLDAAADVISKIALVLAILLNTGSASKLIDGIVARGRL